MEHFRKIWNEETNSFLISHKDMNKNYKAFYSAFMAKFPGCEVSYTAFKNQLSRLDLCKTTRSNFSTKQVPLYSEHQKKGYTFIKIAEPNEWISKSKWVYIATHPAEAYEHYSTKQKYLYIFLDGNNRNFAPDNIEAVERSVIGVLNSLYKLSINPDENRVKILQARLYHVQNLGGLKTGTCVQYPSGIRNREKMRETHKRYWANLPEEKKKELIRKSHKRQMERIKADPERYEKYKAYHREWQRKRRLEQKSILT